MQSCVLYNFVYNTAFDIKSFLVFFYVWNSIKIRLLRWHKISFLVIFGVKDIPDPSEETDTCIMNLLRYVAQLIIDE